MTSHVHKHSKKRHTVHKAKAAPLHATTHPHHHKAVHPKHYKPGQVHVEHLVLERQFTTGQF